MRVTNRASTRNYLRYMNNALAQQSQISERLGSGNRFEKISDDVSSGVKAMKTKSEMYKTQKHHDNVATINDTLTAAEDSFTAASDILKEALAKVTKGVSATAKAQRDIIGQEIGSMKNEILQLANSKYGGSYLFSGSNNYGAPFTLDADSGKLKYNGVLVDDIKQHDNGTYFYEKGGQEVDIPLNDDIYMDVGLGIRMTGSKVDPQTGFNISYGGPEVFGFGTTDGLSDNIINLLDDIANEFKSETYDETKMDKLFGKLSKVYDNFNKNLTDVGSKTQFLETMTTRLQNNIDQMENTISRLTGSDYVEESTHQSTNYAITQALYKLGTNIIPMSLMDFIS